jgi:hypothetical protein
MSVSPRPTKIIIIVALAAVMIGIALAIVLNYQTSISAIDEAQTTMPDIEVLTPEAIVMKKGETKLIPLEVRIISKEPLDAQIAIFSTTSPEAAEQETTSNSGNLDEQFEESRQKGFTNGFKGSLDSESFSVDGNGNGDVIETVNLTLTAPNDITAGDYFFAYSMLGKTTTWDFISSGTMEVTIAQ